MKRQIADISTSFSIEGLAAAQKELAAFTRQVGATMRKLNVSQAIGIDVTGVSTASQDRLAKDQETYLREHQHNLDIRIAAETSAIAAMTAESNAIRDAAEVEFLVQLKARTAERLAAETMSARNIAEKTAFIHQIAAGELEEWRDDRAREQAAALAGVTEASAAKITEIQKSADNELARWQQRHRNDIVHEETLAAKQGAAAAADAKKEANDSYVAWWKSTLDAQADEEADAAKRVAAETDAAKRAAAADYQRWWEDTTRAQADEEADAARRVATETADVKRRADEDYQNWWKTQLDERADEERHVAEDTARVKRAAEEDYQRWWTAALDERDADQTRMLKRGTDQARAFKSILSGIRDGLDFSGLADAFGVVVDKLKGFADGLGAAAGVVKGMIGGVGTMLTGLGTLAATGVRTGQRIATAMASVSVKTLQVAANVVTATARFVAMGVAAGAAAGAAAFALGKVAADSSHKFIQSQEQVADVLGMNIAEFSEFAAYAAGSSVGMDDLRQSMTQFLGVAGQAKDATSAYGKQFASIGVAVTTASGKVRPFMDILSDFAVATSKMGSGERAAILTQIFGDDDATKVGRLMNAMSRDMGRMGKNSTAYRKEVERLRKNGAIISQDDLRISQEYKEATTDLGQAFKGLQLEFFRVFGPRIALWIRILTNHLRENREGIVDWFRQMHNAVITVIRDFLAVFNIFDSGQAVEHTWLFKAKELFDNTAVILKELAVVAVDVAIVIKMLAYDFNSLVKAQTGLGVVDWYRKFGFGELSQIVAGIRHARLVVFDLYDILSGNGFNMRTTIGFRMLQWGQQIRRFATDIIAYVQMRVLPTLVNMATELFAFISSVVRIGFRLFTELPAMLEAAFVQLLPFLEQMKIAVMDLVNGLISGDMSQALSAWGEIGVMLHHGSLYAFEFARNIFAMTVLGQEAQGSFAWLTWVVDAFRFLTENIKNAVKALKPFYDFVSAITQPLFGFSAGTALVILQLARMTGVLALVLKVGAMVASLFGLQAIVGAAAAAGGAAFGAAAAAAGGLSWGMTLPAAFVVLKAGIVAMIPAIWAAIAPFVVWGLVIAGLIAAFILLPKIIADALDSLSGALGFGTNEGRIQNSFDKLKADSEKSYEDKLARDRAAGIHRPDVETVRNDMQQRWANERKGGTGFAGIDDLLGGLSDYGNGPMNQYNFDFGGGGSAELFGDAGQLDAILGSQNFTSK